MTMWKKPWGIAEGVAVAAGLVVIGALLQACLGPINWQWLAWPANFIVLAAIVAVLIAAWLLRQRAYFLRFASTPAAAVPAACTAALFTVVMGVTRQAAHYDPAADPIGISAMLRFFPFVIAYAWVAIIVGLTAIGQLSRFSIKRLPSLLCHAGLFIALACGALGSADMQRLKMYCSKGQPEWRAIDEERNVVELPLAVELEKFSIDEYPPCLMLFDTAGNALPKKKPAKLVLAPAATGSLGAWSVRVVRYYESAYPSQRGFAASTAAGSASAAEVEARRGDEVKRGWVSCGSFAFPPAQLDLAKDASLAMPPREPRRYSADIDLYTRSGKNLSATIEVNKPLRESGYDIYLLSYDEQMGKWSDTCVLEIVSDPWLPAVYAGMFMILAGAAMMLLFTGRRKAV